MRQGLSLKLLSLLMLYFVVQSLGCGLKYNRNFTALDGPVHVGLDISENRAPTDRIRIITFNIKSTEDRGPKIDKAIAQLQEPDLKDADVILLQEMDYPDVKRIATQLRYNYVYYPAVIHYAREKPFGNAILTKWEILDHTKIILPHLDPVHQLQRIAVVATIAINGHSFGVYSVHLGTTITPSQRGDQIDCIIRGMSEVQTEFDIIGGDFNTFDQANLRSVKEPLDEVHFVHATKDIKWTHRLWHRLMWIPYWRFTGALDHIFVRGSSIVRLGSGTVQHNKEASDHLPIWVELKLP